MRTYFLVLIYFLLGAWAVTEAHQADERDKKEPKPITVTISCAPARSFMVGFDDKGNGKQVEDWSAECKITNAYGDVIFEGSYFGTIPQSKKQAWVYSDQVANHLANETARTMKQMRDAQ